MPIEDAVQSRLNQIPIFHSFSGGTLRCWEYSGGNRSGHLHATGKTLEEISEVRTQEHTSKECDK